MDNDLRQEEGFFNAKDHLRLFYRSAAPKDGAKVKAHVVLVHGYADHTGRYKECFRRLAQAGYYVHAFDCRGHGQSDGRRGYCESFQQFDDDLTTFLDRVRPQVGSKKLFALGHSNGGLIVTHWGLSKPQGIAGFVLTSPFFDVALKVPVVKMLGAKVIGKIVPWLPFKGELTSDMFSHDVEWQRATDRDPLYLRVITPGYFFESRAAQEEVRRRASELPFPTLLLSAGDDPVVSTPASRDFFGKIAASDKQYKEYPGMFHEILNEVGKDQVYADVLSWLDTRC